ncbi:hypothetical protein RM780_07590 [Streptomyces sp. DSM 44917]|uniref:Uncharacterized protein n=2 Tax=Streptomyces TaxID=1883 RepID=A0A3B0A374_9ACTN|nr:MULTISPECIES: hypothetical protein [Streptomyces]MDT0306824.1 hypothetical protein [Streptomyces sp. DSM 44917]RKN55072.1 hypothetical protein D7231_34850 [Streptomyces klenkii]
MRKFPKNLFRTGAVLSGAFLFAITTATSASATTLSHGSDRAQATAYAMRAYDGESDGNGVYADAYLANGAHVSQWDGNGSDGNWGPWAEYSSRIARFRVCEDHVGCSGWVNNPS